jgi:hypothetical protein
MNAPSDRGSPQPSMRDIIMLLMMIYGPSPTLQILGTIYVAYVCGRWTWQRIRSLIRSLAQELCLGPPS